MTPNRSYFAHSHGPSIVVMVSTLMLTTLVSGCAGSSSPSKDTNQLSATSPTNDTRRFSVQVEWDIPLARTNGDPLYVNDLAGYEVQYSTDQEQRVHSFRINDPLQTSIRLRELRAGDYQFTIAAREANGRYGQFAPGVALTLR